MHSRKKNNRRSLFQIAFIATFIASVIPAFAYVDVVEIKGSDAIFLAGRTDVTIPPASEPWTTGTYLVRHSSPTPEEIQETLPPYVEVFAGDIVYVSDPADGGVHFDNGFGPPTVGPSGTGNPGSDLTSLDGISGYRGPEGPLVGLFLDDTIPDTGPAPATLDFSASGLGTDFPTLSPQLGQVFYIGDGITSSSVFQTFIAPAGATRLFLGIPDGFDFNGAPGAYDDNDGAYTVIIGVNEEPFQGACCLPIYGCVQSFSQNECENILKGIYQGNDTTCDPDPCYDAGRCFYTNIIAFYRQSLKDNKLKPKVPKEIRLTGDKDQIKNVKRQRRKAMRSLLTKACELIDKGFYTAACAILQEAYVRIDGKGHPADWFRGEAKSDLATMIQDLRGYNCQ